MSHMIEMNEDGSAKIAYVGEVPWHGLGKRVLPDLTPEQMMTEAGANWTVRKLKCYVDIKGKRTQTGQSALVRDTDDRVLSIVSNDWNTLQNADAFAFFDDFVKAGDMEMHTAGVLRDGQVVWALARIKNQLNLFGSDTIEPYLLFTNPHKYGWSIDVRGTFVRVVCNNTITAALGSGQSDRVVRVNHRQKFDADEVKATLGVAKERLETYKAAAEVMGSKKYSRDTLETYFGKLLKKDSRNYEKAMAIVETQPGAQFAPGTYWNAFNAVTFMADHDMGRGDDTRISSAWYGSNRTLKNKALELGYKMAEAA